MKLKPSLRSSGERGFSLLELMVSSALGMVIIAIVLSTFLSNRTLVQYDLDRTSVNQNLRSVLDIVGTQIQLAGENLSPNFPAIEIIDGGVGSPDELVLRRNLLDEILKLCQDVSSGTNDLFYFAVLGTEPGCTYADQVQNFTAWNTYLTDVASPAAAYIYDPATENGHFFEFTSMTDDGAEMYLQISGSTAWQNNFQVGQTAAYIIEEWRFQLIGDVLQLVENDDILNPSLVTFGLEDFQLQATLEDGTVVDEFLTSDDWTEIASIRVTVNSSEGSKLQDIERTLSAEYFPRNVLSN